MFIRHGLISATAPFGNIVQTITPRQIRRTMATASHISLTPATAGSYHVPSISSQSCDIASSLLQTNHEKNHMYFNDDGFHNHIVHHVLTIFALGATPSEIQRGFDHNNEYQKPQKPLSDRNVQQMSDPDKFKSFLGKQKYFHDYLAFFTNEISSKGWQNTLLEHLFAGTPHSEDLLKRMFGGFYHPIIHLGFGIEFSQPAIIAEALAQAATHDVWIAKLLDPVEQAVQSNNTTSSSKSLVQLLHEARQTPKLRTAAHWDDANKVRDGVLARAPEETIALASQFTVRPDELDRKTAEVMNAAVYFTGFSQRRNKIPKIDFYFMHCANSSIFWPVFMKQDWLGAKEKCRLVEWKGRVDLAMYVSRRTPELLVDEVRKYKPKEEGGWESVFRRVDRFEDDGHASKLIRVLARGEEVCRPFEHEGEDVFPVRGGDWLKLAHLVIDSVEVGDPHWVRSAGFDEAWEGIPDKAKL